MTDSPDKAGKPKPRRTGQRQEVAKGKHVIRVFLGRDSSTGKRHYYSEVFFGGARQAEDRIREIIRRHRAGEPVKANADTFDAFLDEWLESKRLAVAESSLKTYKQAIEVHIRPNLGQKLLARVTADDVQRLYGKLHADGLSRASIQYVHVVLGMIFKLAVRRKKLLGSPMAGVEIPKEWADAEDEDNKSAMTAEQVAKFLAAAEGHKFENLFKLAFHVGFRPGELLGLKWGDLDGAAKTLRINRNIVWRKAGDWYLKIPKTRNSKRTLPLTDAMMDVINRERKSQLEARLKAGKLWTDHGFIFCDATGQPYPQWAVLNDCKRILKAAGLPLSFKTYTTRHTMATLLIEGGTNVKAVSERLGHSKVNITLQQYVHVSQGMQADVSEELRGFSMPKNDDFKTVGNVLAHRTAIEYVSIVVVKAFRCVLLENELFYHPLRCIA